MPPTTLEHSVLSTTQAAGSYDQWISVKPVRITRTRPAPPIRFVRLSRFDVAVNQGLDRLATLGGNWDAEGAHPVDPRIIEAARELISAIPRRLKRWNLLPAVVPMRKGNLQLEWHTGERTLELEIEAPGTIHYLKWDPSTSVEEEDFVPITNLAAVTGLIEWFRKG